MTLNSALGLGKGVERCEEGVVKKNKIISILSLGKFVHCGVSIVESLVDAEDMAISACCNFCIKPTFLAGGKREKRNGGSEHNRGTQQQETREEIRRS